jgi:cyclic-di-GMP phosphodiesterase TipF (flagellum assembly factor)
VLQAYGIELIAEKIESEDDLAELLGHGIDYGQGYLFGVPSPSRDA